MGSLVLDFLKGAERITAHVFYRKPLEIGQEPLVVPSPLLGQAPKVLSHSIITTFTHQFDDKTDMKDVRLAKVFEELVLQNNGIVRIQDRTKRISVMNEEAGKSLSRLNTAPVLIPLPSEKNNAGMQEAEKTFRTLVPFPRVREFLEYWQEHLDGPMIEVQMAIGSMVKSEWRHVGHMSRIN